MEILPRNKFAFLFLLIGLCACVGHRQLRLENHIALSNCNQHNVYAYTPDQMPQQQPELEPDTLLTSRFSQSSLHVANAIGALDLLRDYMQWLKQTESNPSVENQLRFTRISHKLNQRIQISSLEVSAISSEIDCEDERSEQVANFLRLKEDATATRLTVGAIVAGATGAIVSAILLRQDHDNAGEHIGIATGIVEATLGLLLLSNKRKVIFQHPRNILAEIWEGHETSAILPPSVWYYLTSHNPNQPDAPPLRDQIIERWKSFGQISEGTSSKNQKLSGLYFGKGGKYTAEQLANRANMLDQVDAHISLMKQDLKGLAIELESIPVP